MGSPDRHRAFRADRQTVAVRYRTSLSPYLPTLGYREDHLQGMQVGSQSHHPLGVWALVRKFDPERLEYNFGDLAIGPPGISIFPTTVFTTVRGWDYGGTWVESFPRATAVNTTSRFYQATPARGNLCVRGSVYLFL